MYELIRYLDRIERKLDTIMAQDTDTLTAVQAVQTAFATLQADVAAGLGDLTTILTELQAANGDTPDANLTQAINIANSVTTSINSTDAQVKAALAQIPTSTAAAPPATTTTTAPTATEPTEPTTTVLTPPITG